MAPMRYVLAVLSHGNPYSPTAEACLDSFLDHVTPMPEFVCYRHDGPGHAFIGVGQQEGAGIVCTAGADQLGFCASTRSLWVSAVAAAITVDAEYLFWLEHDFVFRQHVDLEQLAYVLRVSPGVAQMALVRGPVSPEEQQAGSLVASRPNAYREKMTHRGIGTRESPSETFDWLEHRSYFTTNPSLMRMEFMRDNVWPEYEHECEGRFGIDLVQAGFSFGLWGWGDEEQVAHIGERTGKGY